MKRFCRGEDVSIFVKSLRLVELLGDILIVDSHHTNNKLVLYFALQKEGSPVIHISSGSSNSDDDFETKYPDSASARMLQKSRNLLRVLKVINS